MSKYYWSFYNRLYTINNKEYILYNSLSNSLLELDQEAYQDIVHLQEQLNAGTYTEDNEYHALLLNKAVISTSTYEEGLEIQRLSRLYKQASDDYIGITILPTLDCNFRCTYCFEKPGNNKKMSPEVIDSLLKYIIANGKDKLVSITWFGGEPLLATDVIDYITDELIKYEINFQASIISNGYLLTTNVLEKFKRWRIQHIQVTVDGIGETHNAKRPHKEYNNSFEVIEKNLSLLTGQYSKDIKLAIRINIDKNNAPQYHEIAGYLQSKFKSAHVYPGIITGEENNSSCKSTEGNCNLNSKDHAAFIKHHKENHNLNVSSFYPSKIHEVCSANSLRSLVIGPEGEFYKCWNDVGRDERIVGWLDTQEQRPSNKLLMSRYILGSDPFQDKKCRNCYYLPLCNGGCAAQRYENTYEGKKHDTCLFYKHGFHDFLKYHMEKLNMKKETNAIHS